MKDPIEYDPTGFFIVVPVSDPKQMLGLFPTRRKAEMHIQFCFPNSELKDFLIQEIGRK